MLECMKPAIVVLTALAIAGLSDVKSRDIDPVFWMISIPLATGVYAYSCGPQTVSLGSLLLPLLAIAYMPAIVSLVLYKLGLLGGADVWALTLIAAGFPLHPALPIPSTLAAVIIGSVTMMMHRAASVARVCGIRCVIKARVRVDSGRIISDPRMRFWIVDAGEGIDVSQEPWEIVARNWSSKRLVKASPGLPYIAHLALGLGVYIIILVLVVDWIP